MNTVAMVLACPLVVWSVAGGFVFMMWAPRTAPSTIKMIGWLLVAGPVVWLLGAITYWQIRNEED